MAPDLIRFYFKGGPAQLPDFELFPHEAPTAVLQTHQGDATVSLESGPMTAEICTTPGSYGIQFRPTDDCTVSLASSESKGLAVIDVPSRWTSTRASETSVMATNISANAARAHSSSLRYMLIELKLGADELIYGMSTFIGV